MDFAILVTITGLVVVFAALAFLTFCIWLMGKLLSSLTKPKQPAAPKTETKPAAPAPKAPAPVANASAGIPGEVVAAISAAVASMMGGKPFAVRSIKRKKQTRPAWGAAGIVENTRPF
ncbi:OadG family protein [Bittarella massiliensis (ex Durand et al. 2017)]|uniref:OadG family protein n=1 Tax=Bittarella massiliensis (ex Durand et al. 2017) TaxID=1720313 RepID=UPI001AA0ECAA|nr:OadG family protein [Bittarella massiliensis (ex Durand et al. 2017)]MBO1679459.1 OadG family protein [Bittarella massiliensis (ex Durand et al. 2017)]